MNMKVILNKDLATLGEEGDVKEVAKGYARNYLFPRKIAVPYTERTVRLFEARKDEIEARKSQKRQDAASVKERLEAEELTITMPAGVNGKLYGAVTSLTIVDELAKRGFHIERKRVEIPGNSLKSVGRYKAAVKLYGNAAAEVTIIVQAHIDESEAKAAAEKTPRKERRERRHDEARSESAPEAAAAQAPAAASESPAAAEASDKADSAS